MQNKLGKVCEMKQLFTRNYDGALWHCREKVNRFQWIIPMKNIRELFEKNPR